MTLEHAVEPPLAVQVQTGALLTTNECCWVVILSIPTVFISLPCGTHCTHPTTSSLINMAPGDADAHICYSVSYEPKPVILIPRFERISYSSIKSWQRPGRRSRYEMDWVGARSAQRGGMQFIRRYGDDPYYFQCVLLELFLLRGEFPRG